MQSDLNHLRFLLKASSSLNLFNRNNLLFCVALNDYRYYKVKFIKRYSAKSLENLIEDGLEAQIHWKSIKHPFDGKTKIGFKSNKQENWQNIAWISEKNKKLNLNTL